MNLTKEDQFLDAAEKQCSEEIKNLAECGPLSDAGHKLSCLLENIDSMGPGQCKAFLIKIGTIVFSDYRLIEKFTVSCKDDLTKYNCGRLDADEEVSTVFVSFSHSHCSL